MNLIAAVDNNWGIGKDGDVLFHIPQDVSYFREMTMGKVIIMGRKTFESLPVKNHILPGRKMIVLTKNHDFKHDGVSVCHNVDVLLRLVGAENPDNLFVIGGGEIYEQLLPYCHRAYITKVNGVSKADTFMPNLDTHPDWLHAMETKEFLQYDPVFKFVIYERVTDKAHM